MSAADIAINIAAQFTGKTAFDKAENSAAKLQKSVKNLGRQLGLALGTAAIVNYGKQSVKAFAADDNAARSLGKTLENLGLNTRYAGSELNGYISRLEQQTGVLDDELRPAMDRLLRATGSVADSQKLLGLALDISAGTGKDLTSVSQGLQKAYLGNNASLGRLGVGLSKAELKSSSFIDIQTKLTTLFAGQAKDAAESFQGSLNKLTVASNNAKEAIGKGLVESLMILTGGGGSVDGAVGVIDKMANGIATGSKNIAFMIKQFEALKPVIIALGAVLLIAFAPLVAAVAGVGLLLAVGGKNLKKAEFAKGNIPGGAGGLKSSMTVAGQTENALGKKQRLAIEKQNKALDTGNKLKTIDNNATARKIVLTGDQLALQELEKKFDVERIGLFAAMNQATDGETKMRLLSLIAIKDQNAALAGQITKANQATDALEAFRQAILASIRALLDKIAAEQAKLMAVLGISSASSVAASATFASNDPNAVSGGMAGAVLSNQFSAGSFRAAEAATTNIQVNVAGTVTTERDLVSAITQGIYNNQASGIPISYTTAYR
jgi:hypothetical protein